MTDSESSDCALRIPSRCASVNLYSCSYEGCSKTFSRPSRLETHMLAHTGERPFKCDLCDKDFTRNQHLKRHKQVNHQGIKPTSSIESKCEHCGDKFANKYSLKKHIKKFHDVKQYFCDICSMSFHKNHLLRDHKLLHTGDTFPHKCSQCDKQFKYPGQLKRHERIHKGYVCNICNLSMDKWSDLQQHKSVEHVDVKSTESQIVNCEICDKKFSNKALLKKHSLIHKETRDTFHCPFEFCPRWFYFKNNLTQHIRSFHEGKKYLCSQSGCTNKFTSKQKLLEHLNTVHQADYIANKAKKVRKPPRKRKDKGSFKAPMASVLTGVDCSGAKALLGDEIRPLDSLENISREVGEFINNTSEASASEAETFVGCRKGNYNKSVDTESVDDPNLILANIKRLEAGKHFNRVRIDDTDFSSDTDCDPEYSKTSKPSLSHSEPKQSFDFSKFMK